MALIPKPQFPNVPKLPGVPQLKRSLLPQFAPTASPIISGVITIGRLALALTQKPVWGIYKISPPKIEPAASTVDQDGNPLLDTVVVEPPPQPIIHPDSFLRMQQDRESDVTTAPIQEQSFAAYNKVATPFELKLRLFKSGTLKERQDFLDELDTITDTVDLYKVVTPERIYMNCNVQGTRITREGNRGAFYLAEVEVSFIQIRQVKAQYTNTAQNTQDAKAASAQPVENVGTVNAIPPPNSVATAVDKALAPLRSISKLLGG